VLNLFIIFFTCLTTNKHSFDNIIIDKPNQTLIILVIKHKNSLNRILDECVNIRLRLIDGKIRTEKDFSLPYFEYKW
jgi:hypothetical protein